MKKLSFTFLMAMLSIFVANALPDSKRDIELSYFMENYTAINDSVIQRMNMIKARVDSVHTQMKSDSEKNWLGCDIDQSNVWIALFGFLTGLVGAIFGILGYTASKRTADNVMRASSNVQEGQFNDLIRHLYRNLVCTLAFIQKTLKADIPNEEKEKEEEIRKYPSEEHLLKLKVLPEDVLHLEKYNNNPDIYQKMHKLKLQLRNYDVEIDTALMHFGNKNIRLNMVRNDMASLAFKPLFLINTILQITDILKADKNNTFTNAASIMTRCHVENLIKEGKCKGKFEINEFVDLNDKLPFTKEELENKVYEPYDGLRRSRNMLFGEPIDYKPNEMTEEIMKKIARNNVAYDKRFQPNEKESDYSILINEICRQNQRLNDFKNNITAPKDFPFKENFLTMLSIDVTIELNKIHMIDIK